MEGSWLDSIPSNERMKLRRRMRSPEAYERLREKVKGPEDLAKEMRQSETLAELHFSLESEPSVQNALKAQVEKDLQERGIDGVIDVVSLPPDVRQALEQGKFTLTVSAHPQSHHDALAVLPEGNVAVKLPLKQSFNDRYVGQFLHL